MATKGGEGCNVTSASTLITVVNDPSVSTQPQGFTECTGGTLQLSVVAAGGTPLLTYQWQKSDDGSTGWTDIAAATSTAYTPNSVTTGTFYYRVVVSAAGVDCGTVNSNPVTVVIAPDPEVQVTVPTTTVCTDGRVILTANPTGGTGTCTVQWQSKLDTSSTWNDVPGATGNTYQTSNLKATSNYRAVMSCSGNGCCN
jgi:fibronectin type 3 domain-containing protein